MKDTRVYFDLILNEIGTYCITATKVGHIGYDIEYIFLAKNIQKAFFSCFRNKTTLESVKKSNHG